MSQTKPWTGARHQAAVLGQTKYEGLACRSCGCEERYVSNNNCVECSKKHAKAYNIRDRALVKALKLSRNR